MCSVVLGECVVSGRVEDLPRGGDERSLNEESREKSAESREKSPESPHAVRVECQGGLVDGVNAPVRDAICEAGREAVSSMRTVCAGVKHRSGCWERDGARSSEGGTGEARQVRRDLASNVVRTVGGASSYRVTRSALRGG